MKDINDLFIPYQQALDLKELGFDEEVLKVYDINLSKTRLYDYGDSLIGDDELYAPLYSQAFKFFRDKGYAIMDKPFFSSKDTPNITYAKDIIHWSSGKVYKGARFNSYEESELECLKKLIELEKK